jgi:hypothetical protein
MSRSLRSRVAALERANPPVRTDPFAAEVYLALEHPPTADSVPFPFPPVPRDDPLVRLIQEERARLGLPDPDDFDRIDDLIEEYIRLVKLLPSGERSVP